MTERRKTIPIDTLSEVVKLAVHETLTGIGFDMSDPIEVQKDVAHNRRSRKICEAIQDKALATVVGLFITGIIGSIIYWVKGGHS